jgi:hypothetical protein
MIYPSPFRRSGMDFGKNILAQEYRKAKQLAT